MAIQKSHAEYLKLVEDEASERADRIKNLIEFAFANYIYEGKSRIIKLEDLTADMLTQAFLSNGDLVKPFFALCNMGKRAMAQDVGLDIDTYNPRLNAETAKRIAEYIHPLLPKSVTLDELVSLDRHEFVGTSIRKTKGAWEKVIVSKLREQGLRGKKRKFKPDDSVAEEFELDFAIPETGDVEVGIDVKHIGHPSDKQKRGDEIVNKAVKLWKRFPSALFYSVVKYPYPDDIDALFSRLKPVEREFDGVFVTGDEEIDVTKVAKLIAEDIKTKKPHLFEM